MRQPFQPCTSTTRTLYPHGCTEKGIHVHNCWSGIRRLMLHSGVGPRILFMWKRRQNFKSSIKIAHSDLDTTGIPIRPTENAGPSSLYMINTQWGLRHLYKTVHLLFMSKMYWFSALWDPNVVIHPLTIWILHSWGLSAPSVDCWIY